MQAAVKYIAPMILSGETTEFPSTSIKANEVSRITSAPYLTSFSVFVSFARAQPRNEIFETQIKGTNFIVWKTGERFLLPARSDNESFIFRAFQNFFYRKKSFGQIFLKIWYLCPGINKKVSQEKVSKQRGITRRGIELVFLEKKLY